MIVLYPAWAYLLFFHNCLYIPEWHGHILPPWLFCTRHEHIYFSSMIVLHNCMACASYLHDCSVYLAWAYFLHDCSIPCMSIITFHPWLFFILGMSIITFPSWLFFIPGMSILPPWLLCIPGMSMMFLASPLSMIISHVESSFGTCNTSSFSQTF